MTLEKFEGSELRHIDPSRLINKNKEDKTEQFFLVLGTVFNDLKGIVLFEKLISEKYEKPNLQEATIHAGEYAGIHVQTHKLLAAIINEFMAFLKKNEDVLMSREFNEVLENIAKYHQTLWKNMTNVAFGRSPDTSDFAKVLVAIRNNVAFHYNQSGKNLRKGFIKRFMEKEKDERNKLAYYSISDNLAHTRFYYCDAAVEEYIFMQEEKLSKGNGTPTLVNYRKQLKEVIDGMNFTITALLKQYLKTRPQVK